MAGQTSGKTTKTTGRATGTTTTGDATTDRATDQTVDVATPTPVTTTSTSPATPVRQLPAPSPRTGVAVNATTALRAFTSGSTSQTVRYVQHVLRSRGFDPGNVTGVVTYETRAAYARFQESIDESPTGVPTARSLDYLGFNVVG